MREREGERETETDRQTDRERDRQKDRRRQRETDRYRDRDRQIQRQRQTDTETETDTEIHRQRDRDRDGDRELLSRIEFAKSYFNYNTRNAGKELSPHPKTPHHVQFIIRNPNPLIVNYSVGKKTQQEAVDKTN